MPSPQWSMHFRVTLLQFLITQVIWRVSWSLSKYDRSLPLCLWGTSVGYWCSKCLPGELTLSPLGTHCSLCVSWKEKATPCFLKFKHPKVLPSQIPKISPMQMTLWRCFTDWARSYFSTRALFRLLFSVEIDFFFQNSHFFQYVTVSFPRSSHIKDLFLLINLLKYNLYTTKFI